MYVDDIKLFAQNGKDSETLIRAVRIYSQDIGMEFGMEKWAMQIMKSRKWDWTGGIELPNQHDIRTLCEKETYKYGKQTPLNTGRWNKKIKKGEQENYSKPNYIADQRDKYRNCPPRKILWTIRKVDQRKTSTNGPDNKKTYDGAYK